MNTKNMKKLTALILTFCMLFSLAAGGCGPKKPKAEDAEKYVQAILDIMCKGDYDHSVNIVDIDDYNRDALVDEALEGMLADIKLSEDVVKELREIIISFFSKAKYTVGTAAKVDGGFDVPVTVEPVVGLNMQDAATQATQKLLANPSAVAGKSTDEITDILMAEVISMLKADLDNVQYGEPAEVTVRYKEIEDGVYGIDEEDGNKLGASLFQTAEE